jgi:hypothetical protein
MTTTSVEATGLLAELLAGMVERQAVRIADLDRRLREVEDRLAGTLEVGHLVATTVEVGDPCGPARTTMDGAHVTIRHAGADAAVLSADTYGGRVTVYGDETGRAVAALLAMGDQAAELTLSIADGHDHAEVLVAANYATDTPRAQVTLAGGGDDVQIEAGAEGGTMSGVRS